MAAISRDKPYSEACERNRTSILEVLRVAFADRTKVLEIGSGTGQHAVHFARHLPHLAWQPSDLEDNIAGIGLWREEARLPNLLEPIILDIDEARWPDSGADAVFTANTLHIVSWPRVQQLFERAAALLPAHGVLAVYGPFNYGGLHTSESNARFDLMLRQRDPRSGIRDLEKVDELAGAQGLRLVKDCPMPANNRTVLWVKSESGGSKSPFAQRERNSLEASPLVPHPCNCADPAPEPYEGRTRHPSSWAVRVLRTD